MIKRALQLALVMSQILLSGCFFGTFQTAETIPAGAVDAAWNVNVPLYFDKQTRNSAKQHNEAYIFPNIGGYLAYGASNAAEFGIYGSLGEGIGPFGKIRMLSEYSAPLSFAFLGGFAYHPVAQGISYKLELILSRRLSPFSQIYGGFHYGYQPDYRRDGPSITSVSTFKTFPEMFIGVDLGRRKGVRRRLRRMPFSLTMELGLPLTPAPAMFMGFQFKI